jgi:hypothetical protein
LFTKTQALLAPNKWAFWIPAGVLELYRQHLIMARNCKGMIGLLMVFFFASASALGDRGFFADNLSSSKVSKVKTANYYGHSNTELSCLSQLNFKSCRFVYGACPPMQGLFGRNNFLNRRSAQQVHRLPPVRVRHGNWNPRRR